MSTFSWMGGGNFPFLIGNVDKPFIMLTQAALGCAGRVAAVNKPFLNIFGYTEDEVIGANGSDLMVQPLPDDGRSVVPWIWSNKQHKSPTLIFSTWLTWRSKRGLLFETAVRAQVFYSSEGEAVLGMICIEHITPRDPTLPVPDERTVIPEVPSPLYIRSSLSTPSSPSSSPLSSSSSSGIPSPPFATRYSPSSNSPSPAHSPLHHPSSSSSSPPHFSSGSFPRSFVMSPSLSGGAMPQSMMMMMADASACFMPLSSSSPSSSSAASPGFVSPPQSPSSLLFDSLFAS